MKIYRWDKGNPRGLIATKLLDSLMAAGREIPLEKKRESSSVERAAPFLDRRQLLEAAGKYALVTPPAITLLLTSGGSTPAWASGGTGRPSDPPPSNRPFDVPPGNRPFDVPPGNRPFDDPPGNRPAQGRRP
jgi:hypothetical protein